MVGLKSPDNYPFADSKSMDDWEQDDHLRCLLDILLVAVLLDQHLLQC